MDTAEDQAPPPGTARSRRRSALVATGAAVGLTLAGLGVPAAQTDSPGTTARPPAPAPPMPDGPGPGGRGHGFAKGGIHGEFTTRAPGGGYQVIATQMGEVTEVSGSSVTVRSEDGFSRGYGVDDNTMVNAGNQGIGDVKRGDQVRVTAVVRDGKASAVDLHDVTQARQLRDRWLPPRPDRRPGP